MQSARMTGGMVEEVGASVSFFIASRLEAPSPLQRGCAGLGGGEGGSMTTLGRSIVGLAWGSGVGGTAVDGGMGGCS
jgi:hypothetical protein